MPTAQPKKRLSKVAIAKLVEHLEDIRLALPFWYGIGDVGAPAKEKQPDPDQQHAENAGQLQIPANVEQEQQQQKAEPKQEEDEYDQEYEDYRTSFDPWDIQFAVDNAASALLKANIVPEFENLKEAPSLSEYFAELFGDEHDLTGRIEYFEELIKGYEDTVSREDLTEAYTVLEGIIKELQSNPRTKPR